MGSHSPISTPNRSVAIRPQTELATGWKVIDSINASSTTVNANTCTTEGQYQPPHGVPPTLYFTAFAALGSATQSFGMFALTWVFSDGTLYGETVLCPYWINDSVFVRFYRT